MKRLALILAAVLLLAACAPTSPRYQMSRTGVDSIEYLTGTPFIFEDTLAGLESRASYVVRGRIGTDARTLMVREEYIDPNLMFRPSRGYTLVTLEVLEVIMGDLAPGGHITIVEPYYIFERVLFTRSHYLPSTPGEEYFFFLGRRQSVLAPDGLEGTYPVIHGERGRYLVTTSRTALRNYDVVYRYLGERADFDLYFDLWLDVLNAYMR